MAKCGCANAQCMCEIQSSETVEVSGFGTSSEPYLISQIPPLQVEDTTTLDLTLSSVGSGQLQLSAIPIRPAIVTKFTTSGTWTNPGGLSVIRVMLVAGGGGGGAGGKYTGEPGGSTWAYGGAGGASGSVTNFMLYGSEIPASAPVVVGLGGAGGIYPGTPNGSAGGDSTFGSGLNRLIAFGGGGGGGGFESPTFTVDSVSGGQVVARGGTVLGQAGFSSPWSGAIPITNDPRHVRRLAPGHGGSGMSYQGNSTYGGASSGGWSVPGSGVRGGGSAYAGIVPPNATSDPGHGVDNIASLMGSGGGGGAFGINGGRGGLYGGGGGGGSASWTNAIPAYPVGNGGRGGDGVVIVIGW